MRRILVASLFVSTVLLNAQTATKGQSGTLEARGETPNALTAPAAVAPATDMTATASGRRISTGVIAPKLVKAANIVVATTDFNTPDLGSQKMVVSLVVDEKGTPQNVQIVKSVNPDVDARVLAAVRDYHFAPATLDDQPVPIDLSLVFRFEPR